MSFRLSRTVKTQRHDGPRPTTNTPACSHPNVERVRVVHSDYENTALLDREQTSQDRRNLEHIFVINVYRLRHNQNSRKSVNS